MKNKSNTSNSRIHAIFARAILDKNILIEVKGDKVQANALHTVLEASRYLFHTLHKSDASLEEIQEAMTQKRRAAIEYQKLFNVNWYF